MAGENGDAQELYGAAAGPSCFLGGAKHFEAAQGVNGGEADAREGSNAIYGPGHGIRDVMEFQVEEGAKAKGVKASEYRGTFGSEKLTANFDHAHRAAKPARRGERCPTGVKIQGDNYS